MHSLARGLCPLRMRGSMEHLIRTRYRCASSSRAREIIRSPYIRSRHAARTGASARNLNASRIISIRNATPQGDDPRAISATLRDVSMFTSKSRPAATDPRHGSIRPVSLNNSAARFYRLDFVSPFESRSRTRATDSHPRISLPEIKLASPSIPLSPPLSLSLSLSLGFTVLSSVFPFTLHVPPRVPFAHPYSLLLVLTLSLSLRPPLLLRLYHRAAR